jgi:hypothetical protein
MRKGLWLFALASAVIAAQFTAPELAEHARWEAFLRTARIAGSEQLGMDQGVTEPWRLRLEKDGVTRHALWKCPLGELHGFLESWKYEIAAYELDKLLALGMVPPTVERRFRGTAGSCQLWIDDTVLLRKKLTSGEDASAYSTPAWIRTGYIAQVFDNLIGNEDRHVGNVLVTADNRCILIDHSRTFRTTKAFTEGIPFCEEKHPGADVMRQLPRTLVDRVRALTQAQVKAAAGKYLTTAEVRAVMARRDLLLAEIDRIIALHGEDSVLY